MYSKFHKFGRHGYGQHVDPRLDVYSDKLASAIRVGYEESSTSFEEECSGYAILKSKLHSVVLGNYEDNLKKLALDLLSVGSRWSSHVYTTQRVANIILNAIKHHTAMIVYAKPNYSIIPFCS